MNAVSEYVLRVGAYLIFAVLLEGVLPASGSAAGAKKFVKLVLGLLFMYVLIQPVLSWVQADIPLEALTLENVDVDAQVDLLKENPYQGQAEAMMQEGYEKALTARGLPSTLQDAYQLVEVRWGDPVRVTVARQSEQNRTDIGQTGTYDLSLGGIGASQEEEETLRQSLCEYWGLEEDHVEMRLR